MKPVRHPRSLKSRALQWLAQREQSRAELRRKLMAQALADARVGAPQSGDPSTAAGDDAAAGAAAQVDAVLAWLDAHRFQSDERFVASRVDARSGRYGDLRIQQELKQHGLSLDAEAARALRDTETARAWAVWSRRFGAAPGTRAELAKQSRFLTARGFSPDAVRHVMRQSRATRPETEATGSARDIGTRLARSPDGAPDAGADERRLGVAFEDD